jgi:hypothetical protein
MEKKPLIIFRDDQINKKLQDDKGVLLILPYVVI